MNSIEVVIDSLGPAAHKFAYPLESEMIRAGMAVPLEKAHFLAQTAHESMNFTHVEENLNYRWERLRVVFKKYFPTDILAKQYERKPEKIANKVYASRLGNGDELSGDGWKYRGRGPIQLTGRANYAEASQEIFCDDRLVRYPDLVTMPDIGSKVAVWFWVDRGCKAFALADDIAMVTQKINGGHTGLDERKELYKHFIKMFT